jgi:hypothetical protein
MSKEYPYTVHIPNSREVVHIPFLRPGGLFTIQNCATDSIQIYGAGGQHELKPGCSATFSCEGVEVEE